MIMLSSEGGGLIYVNEKLITFFFETGNGTHLEVVGPEMIFVTQSPKEIMKILAEKEMVTVNVNGSLDDSHVSFRHG